MPDTGAQRLPSATSGGINYGFAAAARVRPARSRPVMATLDPRLLGVRYNRRATTGFPASGFCLPTRRPSGLLATGATAATGYFWNAGYWRSHRWLLRRHQLRSFVLLRHRLQLRRLPWLRKRSRGFYNREYNRTSALATTAVVYSQRFGGISNIRHRRRQLQPRRS